MYAGNRLVPIEAEVYHSDPCPSPSLSNSIAYQLTTRSPRHAWLAHPRLGAKRRPPTKTMDRGSLVHALLLGSGPQIAEVDAEDWKTKAAREQRDAAYERGHLPVLTDDLQTALRDVVEIRERLTDFGIELGGVSEIGAFWVERATDGTEVQCRALMDHWFADIDTIYDLKTCRSGHPSAVQRHVVGYGYDIQRASYVSAIAKNFPERAGRTDFVFLFCELDPAVTVTPYRPAGSMRELGEQRWRRGVDLWARCIKRNEWPGYASGIIEIEAPPWAMAAEFDATVAMDFADAG